MPIAVQPKMESPTVIVVGAGYAGLSTAIECTLRGMKVKMYESAKQLTPVGDVIGLAPNTTRIFSRWGDTLARMQLIDSKLTTCDFVNKAGEIVFSQPLPPHHEGYPNLYAHRSHSQILFYEYAMSVGIEIIFNTQVTEYFENDHEAGIIVDGQRVTADCVVAADGVHSKARRFVTGVEDNPKPSGFAIFRCFCPIEPFLRDPKVNHLIPEQGDRLIIWIGEDTHGIIQTQKQLDGITVFLTHKDTYTVEESWSFRGDPEELIRASETLHPIFKDICKHVPPEKLIDWKLLWRDPIKNWVSEKGRIVLAGDAAHPHLPTSAQGAAQAIEDGASIAGVLAKGGKDEVPLALRIHNRLRYQRTSLTQRIGWETRHRWHQTDWEEIKKRPEYLQMNYPHWLIGVDAGIYATEAYDEVKDHLLNGTPFVARNLPKNYTHEDWTIEKMRVQEKERASKIGSAIQDDW